MPVNCAVLLLPRLEFLCLFGREQSHGDEVQGVDESVGDGEAPGPRDGVAERDRPSMLEQDHGCRGVVGDLGEDVPRVILGEHLPAL